MENEPKNLTPPGSPAPGDVLLAAILFEGGLALLALVLGHFLQVPPLAALLPANGHTPPWLAAGMGVLATVPAVLLALLLDRWPLTAGLRRLKHLMRHEVGVWFRPLRLWEIALVSLLAGVGEELLFRGLVQRGLAQLGPLANSPWLPLVLASLVFGACHALTKTYAVLAAGMGAYLGALYLMTGDLIAPIITHALYDFVLLALYAHAASTPSQC